MYLVTDTCFECGGETIAIFDSKADAEDFGKAFPWLTIEEVDTDELLVPYTTFGYEKWFNERADRALQERSYDCGD
jgi:hypothetical protein